MPIPVDVDGEGMRTDGLSDARLAYVTPSHQFPLGSVMSAARRRELLSWARRNGAYVIEDDYDGEYRYDVPPARRIEAITAGAAAAIFRPLPFRDGEPFRMITPIDQLFAIADAAAGIKPVPREIAVAFKAAVADICNGVDAAEALGLKGSPSWWRQNTPTAAKAALERYEEIAATARKKILESWREAAETVNRESRRGQRI